LIINGSGSGKEAIADIVSREKRIPIAEFPDPVYGFDNSQVDCMIGENIFKDYTPSHVIIFHNKLFSSRRARIIAELAVRNNIDVSHYTDDEYYYYPNLSSFLSHYN
jgi:hypothetical protein